ncbi:MAG: DUF4126 domain-containing protein [Chloroflexota bacterium]|nr:DUF4126 domain-containing protein [Chloroflexota bacterium]
MHIVLGMALAAAAGWNAFLPLLALTFAHRLSGRIPIGSPYTFLASNGGIVVLLLLLPLELFGDKSPTIEAINDRLGLFYRPVAGALIMLATTKDTGLPAVLAAIIGAALALGLHLLKVRYRRPLTGVFGGIPTPVASAGEDFVVAIGAIIALLLPIAGLIVMALAAGLAWWIGSIVRRKVGRDMAAMTTASQP